MPCWPRKAQVFEGLSGPAGHDVSWGQAIFDVSYVKNITHKLTHHKNYSEFTVYIHVYIRGHDTGTYHAL